MWQGFAMAGNERLNGCAYVIEPLMADTSLRAINFWTCEPGDLPAFTTLQEAIDWCRAQDWVVYKSISRENGRLSEGYCTSTERIPWADKWARLSSNISHYLETL